MEKTPARQSASGALTAMAAGDLTSRQLVESCLRRIDAREPLVRAWAYVNPDQALAQAEASDARRALGTAGPLEGVPVGIKDIFDTADMPTENGSKLCAGRRPGADSAVVRRLREAGAVVLGKCVTTEFALSAPPKTRNPLNPEHTPGGSSSGSAAAVADFMVPLAVGSQTGGSMLRPASYCGVFGMKPTFGTVSRAGMSPLCDSLDTPGFFARDPADLTLLAQTLMGKDAEDPGMIGHPKFRPAEPVSAPPRIAVVRGAAWDLAEDDMRRAFEETACALGPSVQQFELPEVFDNAVADHRLIMGAELTACLGTYYRQDKDALDPVTRERIERGQPILAADYLAARDKARRMTVALEQIFQNIDIIITPAATGEAPRGHAGTGNAAFNGYWTMLGVPAVSVPVMTGVAGLPMGLQLVAPWRGEGALLEAAKWVSKTIAGRADD